MASTITSYLASTMGRGDGADRRLIKSRSTVYVKTRPLQIGMTMVRSPFPNGNDTFTTEKFSETRDKFD